MSDSVVSIIIPCYNAERWIGECLNSAIAQTHRPLEIIVIDDGSTDGSIAIINSFYPRVSVIRSANGGPAKARNIGWKAATGEWIQFLDADDLIAADKIAYQLQAAMNLPEECAMVYSEWARFNSLDPTAKVESSWVVPEFNDTPVDLLKSFVATGSQLFRRSWLEKVGGFDESMLVIEDVNLMLRIAMIGGSFYFAGAGRPLFFYRQHLTSTSRTKYFEFHRGCLKNTLLTEEHLTSRGPLTSYQISTLIDAYSYIARATFSTDPYTFQAAYTALCRLSPNGRYIPKSPRHLSVASRLVGYRGAEHVAALYRRAKKLFVQVLFN